METTTPSWKNRTVRWLRIIHRDLGYLMAGICLVYGVSGMLLNHMHGRDPAYKTTEHVLAFPTGMDRESIMREWNAKERLPMLKNAMAIDEEHVRLMLDGGIGVYNSVDGRVDYEVHKKNHFVYWINKLHYNKVHGWNVMANIFAVSLIFFALSGLFMVRGKKGIGGRGKWFLLIGLLIPICYVIFS